MQFLLLPPTSSILGPASADQMMRPPTCTSIGPVLMMPPLTSTSPPVLDFRCFVAARTSEGGGDTQTVGGGGGIRVVKYIEVVVGEF